MKFPTYVIAISALIFSSTVQAELSEAEARQQIQKAEQALSNLIFKPTIEVATELNIVAEPPIQPIPPPTDNISLDIVAKDIVHIVPRQKGPFDDIESEVRRRDYAPVASGCDPLPEFNFIGVDDQGLNNSDLFLMDLTQPQNSPEFKHYLINGRHPAHDLEGMDSTSNPFCSCLWVSSGDNDGGNSECNTGCLYKANKRDGSINLYGDICTTDRDLVEADALAFRLNSNLGYEQLWGWAQHEGLFAIQNPKPVKNMCGDNREAINASLVCAYKGDEPTSEPDRNKFNDLVVEDLTWVPSKKRFYVSIDNSIFTINPTGCGFEFVCTNQTEIEALEYVNTFGLEMLVVGFHDPDGRIQQSSVTALDINVPTGNMGLFCKFFKTKFPTGKDVEGLAYP